jgi:hypothetical protein
MEYRKFELLCFCHQAAVQLSFAFTIVVYFAFCFDAVVACEHRFVYVTQNKTPSETPRFVHLN